MGRTSSGQYVIDSLVSCREAPYQVGELISSTAALDGTDVTQGFWIDPGQAGKVDEDVTRRLLDGFPMYFERATQNKIAYAKPFSAQLEGGNVLIVRSDWTEDVVDELEKFPEGKHDDIVDAASGCHRMLLSDPYVLASPTGITASFCVAPRRHLGQTRRKVEARAETFATQLGRWLQKYARRAAKREADHILRNGLRAPPGAVDLQKSVTSWPDLDEELLRLFRLFGLRQFNAGARGAQAVVGRDTRTIIPAEYIDEYLLEHTVKLKQIALESEKAVRKSVQLVIVDALREERTPSPGDIARRIKNQFHGAPARLGPPGGEVILEETGVGAPKVLPTERYSTDRGTLYAFSSERAALIARTELVQAENAGQFSGYAASGVETKMWLAYTDGRSGPRNHDEMNRVEVPIGDYFELPDGTRMRFPGDPRAPIYHLANCRCSIAPGKVRA
jgi:predicted phage terminase large subunit-like protein